MEILRAGSEDLIGIALAIFALEMSHSFYKNRTMPSDD